MLQSSAVEFGYQQTLITGHYRQQLRDYAKQAAEQVKIRNAIIKKKAAEEKSHRRYESSKAYRVIADCQQSAWRLMQRIGEDWILLIIIGFSVGVISFTMDFFSGLAYQGRLYTFDAASFSVPLQYTLWLLYHTGFCMLAAGVVHLVNPQAAGTGMPELKAILGGIELKGFLSWRSIVAKYVGGLAAMCSGLPLAKGGILACIASCITHLLCKRFTMFKGIYENESRKIEMLAAAVAVAIACTFSSPVSGVLFCIELTATFFEVQNYWRAFFCTVCGTTVYRMLSVLSQYEMTIGAFMKTSLHLEDFPFDVVEFVVFSLLGVICGLVGAAFVYTHRSLILFVRARKKLSAFLQKYRLLYPFMVSAMVACMTFPPFLGQYSGGRLNSRMALAQLLFEKPLFLPRAEAVSDLEATIRDNWIHPETNLFISLVLFFVIQFWCSAFSFTLAVPFGTFTPVFAMGAALGRIVGEAMSLFFPNGINTGYGIYRIVPGGYAIIGAAATSGAVLHVISMALLMHEMTGQVNYLLPTLWATMISNVVARSLMPSMIDSIIQIKKIPFLPVFKHPGSRAHQVLAQDIMQTNLKYLSRSSTYDDVKNMLLNDPFVRSFPLVDTSETMLLIGSVQRNELIDALERHIRNNMTQNPKTPNLTSCREVTFSSGDDSGPQQKGKGANYEGATFVENARTVKSDEIDNNNGSNGEPSSQKDRGSNGSSSTMRSNDSASTSFDQSTTGEGQDGADVPKKACHLRKPILKKTASVVSDPDAANAGGASEPLLDSSQRRSRLSSTASISSKSNPLNVVAPWVLSDLHTFSYDEVMQQSDSTKKRKYSLPHKLIHGLSYMEEMANAQVFDEEKMLWEEERLQDKIDTGSMQIDPAPFQLSEKTSLHKIHSLFVLLRLSQAYVTSFGRLVGIVTIKEVQTELAHPSVHEAPQRMKLLRKTASATIGGADSGMPIIMNTER